MRKIFALVICWFLAFSLGYIVMPTGFNALINWLGPVFGTPFHLILSTLFLLLADPLKYTTLAIAWAVTGFLCGLIIRKRIGSVTTALTVFSSQSIIIGLAGYRIFEIVSTTGIMTSPSIDKVLTLLPPVPEGSSLATILNAPIIGDILPRVQGLTGLPSINFIISLLVNTILLSVVKNIIIVCVAALVGCELGKLASRPFKLGIESFRMRFVKPTPPTPPSILGTPTTSRLIALGLIALLASSTVFTYLAAVNAVPAPYYSEMLLGTLTPRGTAVVTANFFDTVYLTKIDTSDAAFTGCISASLVAQQLSLESISADMPLFFSQIPIGQLGLSVEQALGMYSILPPTILVMIYVDIPNDLAQSRAGSAATIFSNAFGTTLTQLIALPMPMGDHSLTVVIYQSDKTFADTATTIMNTLPETQRDGIATFIGSVYRSGIFTPGATRLSANGTIISTGFVDAKALLSIFSGDQAGPINSIKPFLPSMSGPVPLINVVSYFAGRFHSSPITAHTLKFSDILNTDLPIKFSPSTNASTIITVVPTGNTTKAGEISIPIIKVATTLPTSVVNTLVSTIVSAISGTPIVAGQAPSSDLVSLTVDTVSVGTVVDPKLFEIAFTSRFPLQLNLVKTVSVAKVDRYETVTITVTAYNDDVDPAKNVNIDDSAVLQSYSQGAKLVSGKSTDSWPSISNRTASGVSGTRSISYTLRLLKEGTYTFPAASVSYVYDGVTYTKSSNKVVVYVRSPGLIQVITAGIPYTWALLVRMIDMIPAVRGSGSLILMAAVLVIVLLIALVEYRGFRKWVRGDVPKGKK